jgi:hypothetical protein
MQKHKQVAKDSARKWIVRISCWDIWNDEDKGYRKQRIIACGQETRVGIWTYMIARRQIEWMEKLSD